MDSSDPHIPPPDEEQRERIRNDLDATLFVEAGAGSGKTTALVERVLALVTKGAAEMSNIAAITFSVKAASDLSDRIRATLEGAAAGSPDTVEADRCRRALDQLDGAAIGTLHSFAQRILAEYPIETGIPPGFDVLDEVASGVAFDERWSAYEEILMALPELERTLLLVLAAGVPFGAVRCLAECFERDWDLVADRVPAVAGEPPDVRELVKDLRVDVDGLKGGPCSDDSDKLKVRIADIAEYVGRLMEIGDEEELLSSLTSMLDPKSDPKPPSFKVGNIGRAKAWGGTDTLDALRGRVVALGEKLQAVRKAVTEQCVLRLASELRHFTLKAAHERRKTGRLEFHDLLVLARGLLTDGSHGPAVRARLARRYSRLLLDEFQDTDPIQIELAVRIAAARPADPGAGTRPWENVDVAPGRLFVVGDPKQSIYRFRRADIRTFLDASERFGANGGRVELTANFRTTEPIIAWVNATFGSLMARQDVAEPDRSQPDYLALQPTRAAPPFGPPVSVLGRSEHPGGRNGMSSEQMRVAESTEIAAAIVRIVGEGWEVESKDKRRRARLGDIAILIPTRATLEALEDALDTTGIAYQTESSSLVYASREVRDLLMVLRAVDDPSNHLHVVAALRTPLLACGDDDLFRFRHVLRGHWDYQSGQPPSVPRDDPVRTGLGFLRDLHAARCWLEPAMLLGRIARDRRAFELAAVAGRPRDTWRRLHFVIDQARAWNESIGGNLREYLGWVDRQASGRSRITEAVLPETDADAVRIMTIHSAKGLEFPITIVAGAPTVPRDSTEPARVVFPARGGVGYRFHGQVTAGEYEAWKPLEEEMEYHERIRLLYVACTRARDHLVVSLHRRARASRPDLAARTNAELFIDGMGELLDALPDAAGETPKFVPVRPEPAPAPPLFEEWKTELDAALDRASAVRTVSATALTAEGDVDPDGEPDQALVSVRSVNTRAASAIGRAVHQVLQVIDLSTGSCPGAAVESQCEAEGIAGRSGEVRRTVEAALGAPSVREAAVNPHWREVYVGVPVGGMLLEGYVDLLYRSDGGLVVVDYKTSPVPEPDGAELDRRVERYRNQGAAYALAVGDATGEAVVRVTFVFLTPGGAIERHVEDLDGAVESVRRLAGTTN